MKQPSRVLSVESEVRSLKSEVQDQFSSSTLELGLLTLDLQFPRPNPGIACLSLSHTIPQKQSPIFLLSSALKGLSKGNET